MGLYKCWHCIHIRPVFWRENIDSVTPGTTGWAISVPVLTPGLPTVFDPTAKVDTWSGHVLTRSWKTTTEIVSWL